MKNPRQITNLDELKEEMALLKVRINEHEAALQLRAKSIPSKIAGGALGSVAAFLLSKKLASGTWSILKVATSVMLNKSPASAIGKTVFQSAKTIGMVAIAKNVIGRIRKRFSTKKTELKK